MRIGIFGGTFNPPHIGHLRSAAAVAEQLRLNRLIIVPSGIPPHKPLPDGTPPAALRMEMARATFESMQNVEISDIEIIKQGPCYTADTVSEIKRANPGAQLFLLTGTDMYLTLESWKDSETLLMSATPVVFSRNADDAGKIVEYSRGMQTRYGVRTETIANAVVDISSSQLREMLPLRGGVGYITDTTYSYIIKNRLYAAKPDWEWLREQAYSMLATSRLAHVAGCESEALRLADRWGVDADDAREAAILHDITKKLSPDEHLNVLAEHGINVGKLENSEEKLLHAKSGAALAKSMFGVTDEVACAIMWHTTGRVGMTFLEKIIYLADYIEPERDFPGIGELRAAAYEDVDKAMILGMEISVQDMIARGIIPNRTTYDALDDLRGLEGKNR